MAKIPKDRQKASGQATTASPPVGDQQRAPITPEELRRRVKHLKSITVTAGPDDPIYRCRPRISLLTIPPVKSPKDKEESQ